MTDDEVIIWNKAVSECRDHLMLQLAKRKELFRENKIYDSSNHWTLASLNSLFKKSAQQTMEDKLDAIRKILES